MYNILHSKTAIVRGIGYRSFLIKNTLLVSETLSQNFVEKLRPIYTDIQQTTEIEYTEAAAREFLKPKYLIIRAGHTLDSCIPLHKNITCKIGKKDRKLTLASGSKQLVTGLTTSIYNYRPPSAYTGRGIRIKHEKPIRKAGKKDKQKGRAF